MTVAKLTPKQKKFVDEYLVDLNATAAAERAGYSAKTAAEMGYENLRKPHIQNYVDSRMAQREKRTEITQDMVLQELAKIGFSDMRTFTKWNNRGIALIDSESLTPEQSACVAEVSQTITESGGSIKFKLHDKVAALEKMGRHLGMFKDKLELTGELVVFKGEDSLVD